MTYYRYNPAPSRLRRLPGVLLRGLLCVLCPFSAPSAFAQGLEWKTWNGAADTQRLKIESGAATEEAYFMNVNLGIGKSNPSLRLDMTGTDTIGLRYLKTGSRDARIQVGDPTQTWSLAAGEATAGDFSLIEEGTSNVRFYVQRTTGYVGLGTATPGARLEVVSGTTGWGGWYEAIRLKPDTHAAIYHPGGNIHFGFHSNRNFYWADNASGWYSMILDPTGELTVRDKVTVQGTDNTWGTTVINGRVWSASDNIHLSPPAGSNVIIDDNYREAGGAGGGTPGLQVEGISQFNAGVSVDGNTVIDDGAGWHRTYGNTGYYNGTHGGGWYMIDSSWIRTYSGTNMLISAPNWAGLYITNTAGRSVSLENNTGIGGGGGLRVWDQSGAGSIAEYGSDNKMYVGGNVIRYDSGGGTVRMHSPSNNNNIWFNWNGTFRCYVDSTNVKNFIIDHPADPGKHLIHTTLEGPEAAVFYRGTARLKDGRAEIRLPGYFEALTREEGRTVMVTPEFEVPGEPVSALAHSRVKDGVFHVRAADARNPAQAFSWEVKAARKDIPPTRVEPRKDEVEVKGVGPYTYYVEKRAAASLYPE